MRMKKDSRRGRSAKWFGCLTPSGKVQSTNPYVHSQVARGCASQWKSTLKERPHWAQQAMDTGTCSLTTSEFTVSRFAKSRTQQDWDCSYSTAWTHGNAVMPSLIFRLSVQQETPSQGVKTQESLYSFLSAVVVVHSMGSDCSVVVVHSMGSDCSIVVVVHSMGSDCSIVAYSQTVPASPATLNQHPHPTTRPLPTPPNQHHHHSNRVTQLLSATGWRPCGQLISLSFSCLSSILSRFFLFLSLSLITSLSLACSLLSIPCFLK